jgi:hypothetical protein
MELKKQISRETVGGSICNCYRKGKEEKLKKQEFEPIYRSLANPEVVKLEIGDVIEVFNSVVESAVREVNSLRAKNSELFKQRGFYSQYINALIKTGISHKIELDPVMSQKVRRRTSNGSTYFIVKDKYALYVKRLYGKLNKPQSFPTVNSNKLFNGELFDSLSEHIPVLFIGPNLDRLDKNYVYVTSLVSKKEVNWTNQCVDLFSNVDLKPVKVIEMAGGTEPSNDLNNVNLKATLIKAEPKQKKIK